MKRVTKEDDKRQEEQRVEELSMNNFSRECEKRRLQEREIKKKKEDRRGAKGRTGGRRLDLVDEFFMTLIRLRLGLFCEDIAQRFGISVSYFGNIFSTWVIFLSKEPSLLCPFPSPEKVKMHTPRQFFDYSNTRIIIDCFELFVERLSLLKANCATFSNYKKS